MEAGGLGLVRAASGSTARSANKRVFLNMANRISPGVNRRDALQSFPRELVATPFRHFHRAQALIKINSGLIPLQHGPTQRAPALNRKLRHRREQSGPDPGTAMRRLDKNIFQIDSGASRECRESREINGEPRGDRKSVV